MNPLLLQSFLAPSAFQILLVRNISSPDESVAPTILSGSKRLSNPLGLSPSLLTLFFSLSGTPDFRLSPGLGLLPFSFLNLSNSSMRSAQSKLSLGSQVL